MTNPRIAFCTTCKGRVAHIKETLPANLKDNESYANAVFIIVDYGSEDDLLDYLYNEHKADMDSGRIVLYSVQNVTRFKMAHAKNVAHRCGLLESAEILVNLDADNYTGPDFAQYIADHYEEYGDDTFLWAKMQKGVMPRGISGRIVCHRNAFLKSGGYDEERFADWGKDDKDFNERLRRLDVKAFEIDPKFLLAIRHNDKLRFREYSHLNKQEAVACYEDPLEDIEADHTIVNFGHVGESLVRRNFTPLISIIPTIPTRVFGIGSHKTGTTSLAKAFEILGLESGHWRTAHWAKAIWLEMKALGRSETVERCYAFSDLPIPLLFKELDKAYPGSKFILTLRDEQDWLKSVERHWNPEFNGWRKYWDTDYFTHKIHQALYGRKTFDAEIFLERYRKHNTEVLEYFKDRPNDLLIINIQDNSWIKLCAFLGKTIPDVPYPRSNATPV